MRSCWLAVCICCFRYFSACRGGGVGGSCSHWSAEAASCLSGAGPCKPILSFSQTLQYLKGNFFIGNLYLSMMYFASFFPIPCPAFNPCFFLVPPLSSHGPVRDFLISLKVMVICSFMTKANPGSAFCSLPNL